MINCKRHCKRHRTNQERQFYQTPTDRAEEKIQRCCVFLKKLDQIVDDRIFYQCVGAINSYVSGSSTYVDVRNGLVSILRNHQGLLQEFHQLFLPDHGASRGSNTKNQTPRLETARTVELLYKVEALGKSVHHAFFDALRSPGDMETLKKQLDEVLRHAPSLRDEFKTFLDDSGFLKRERVLEAVLLPKPVMPSYWISPEAEEGSSSSSGEVVLNDKYISVGRYDPPRRKRETSRRNKLEDALFAKDLLLKRLASVIDFGEENVLRNKELREKPPVGFNEVVQWFYGEEKVPQTFETDPRRAVQGILRRLKRMEKEMRTKKEERSKNLYRRQNPDSVVRIRKDNTSK